MSFLLPKLLEIHKYEGSKEFLYTCADFEAFYMKSIETNKLDRSPHQSVRWMAQELQLAEKKKKSSSEEGQGILILRRYRKPKVDQPIRS